MARVGRGGGGRRWRGESLRRGAERVLETASARFMGAFLPVWCEGCAILAEYGESSGELRALSTAEAGRPFDRLRASDGGGRRKQPDTLHSGNDTLQIQDKNMCLEEQPFVQRTARRANRQRAVGVGRLSACRMGRMVAAGAALARGVRVRVAGRPGVLRAMQTC